MVDRPLTFAVPTQVDCEDCARRLHERLDRIPGVRSVAIDLRQGAVTVTVDEDAYLAAQVGAHVRNALTGLHVDARGDAGPPGGHDHGLGAAARLNRRRLLLVLAGGSAVMLLEIAGGYVANSLVLYADAAHYATDLAAVLLAYFAVTWALKGPTSRKTFGYHRAEVVAAFLNAIALWAVSGFLVYHAIQRLASPPEVEGRVVLGVGAVSLVANIGLAMLLRQGTGQNLNVRAAYLHIVSDALGSAAALGAGAAVFFWGLHIADPILTLFVTILIVVFTWNLTRQTLHILLEGAPAHAKPDEVNAAIRRVPGVSEVHDLHVWTLSSGVDSVSAHVVLRATPTDDAVTHDIHRALRVGFGIQHVTVQLEDPSCPCDTSRHGWPGSGADA